MVAHNEPNRQHCYIEFRVTDNQRFEVFLRFFNAMRTYTRQRYADIKMENMDPNQTMVSEGTFRAKTYSKDEDWMLAFKPDDLEYLKMPPHREAITSLRKWRDLSRKERRADINKDPQLQTLADFVDMLRAFRDVEFELVNCAMHDADSARIEYTTYQYPFDGKSALEEMLLFFGFFSIIEDSC